MNNKASLILGVLLCLVRMGAFCQNTKNDTTFLLREYVDGTYHAVFVCKGAKGEPYRSTSNNQTMANANNALGLPARWVPLYLYNHKYYLYNPCDGIYNREYALTDSTLLKFNYDGVDTLSVHQIKQIGKGAYQTYQPSTHQKEDLTIYILDKQKQVALFHYQTSDSTEWSELLVGAEKAKYFPIIVCTSYPDYVSEFTFKEPDYKVLLQTKKP